jgi:AmmeMemoRadiSam system protein A
MPRSACIDLDPKERGTLLGIARASIDSGLHTGRALRPSADLLRGALAEPRAVFVTVTRDARLRGCIGSMEAAQALATSVAEAAYSAAFRDPRFPPLAGEELTSIRIEISVLSPMADLKVASRRALLDQLSPGQDGLVVEDGPHRATFLPKVWEQLPRPEQFLHHLMAKAGLPGDHWSPHVRVQRYTTLSFTEPD